MSSLCRVARRTIPRATNAVRCRTMAVKATVEDGFDSRNHEFFAPTDVVQRVFFERIKELEGEINVALTKPYTRTAAEIKEVEKFIQQEREKLGLTEAEYDIEVDKTVTGNIPNFQQYVKSQK